MIRGSNDPAILLPSDNDWGKEVQSAINIWDIASPPPKPS